MRFYRVRYTVEGGVSGGYTWHTSKRGAEKAVRAFTDRSDVEDGAEVSEVEIEPTKRGILAALKQYASHADNG